MPLFVCCISFLFYELPLVALNSCAMCIYHGAVEELRIITATVALWCELSENLQMLETLVGASQLQIILMMVRTAIKGLHACCIMSAGAITSPN